jgi:hypothetical protein
LRDPKKATPKIAPKLKSVERRVVDHLNDIDIWIILGPAAFLGSSTVSG